MIPNHRQQILRKRLLRLGFTPIAEADFRSRAHPDAFVVEFWHSTGGNTVRVVYAGGKATV